MDIIKLSTDTIDYTQLSLGEPTKNKGNSYFSEISYQGHPLYIQTSLAKIKEIKGNSSPPKYIDLYFSLDSTKKEEVMFIEKMKEFDRNLKNVIKENVDKWFENAISDDDIDYFYVNSFKHTASECILRGHINGTRDTLVFNQKQEERTLSDIKDNEIVAILEVTGIQITSTSFSLRTQIKQVMIFEKKQLTFNKCLIQAQIECNENNIVEDLEEETNQNGENTETTLENNELVPDNTQIGDNNENEYNIHVTLPQLVEDCGGKEEFVKTNIKLENTPQSTDLVEFDINSTLEIEPLEQNVKQDILTEVNLDINDSEPISLKKPNEVFYELYREARKKAKLAKRAAMIAYLEAKNIKNTYMLDDVDDSDDDSDFLDFESEHSENESDSENEEQTE
jgi:hypothetical protein